MIPIAMAAARTLGKAGVKTMAKAMGKGFAKSAKGFSKSLLKASAKAGKKTVKGIGKAGKMGVKMGMRKKMYSAIASKMKDNENQKNQKNQQNQQNQKGQKDQKNDANIIPTKNYNKSNDETKTQEDLRLLEQLITSTKNINETNRLLLEAISKDKDQKNKTIEPTKSSKDKECEKVMKCFILEGGVEGFKKKRKYNKKNKEYWDSKGSAYSKKESDQEKLEKEQLRQEVNQYMDETQNHLGDLVEQFKDYYSAFIDYKNKLKQSPVVKALSGAASKGAELVTTGVKKTGEKGWGLFKTLFTGTMLKLFLGAMALYSDISSHPNGFVGWIWDKLKNAASFIWEMGKTALESLAAWWEEGGMDWVKSLINNIIAEWDWDEFWGAVLEDIKFIYGIIDSAMDFLFGNNWTIFKGWVQSGFEWFLEKWNKLMSFLDDVELQGGWMNWIGGMIYDLLKDSWFSKFLPDSMKPNYTKEELKVAKANIDKMNTEISEFNKKQRQEWKNNKDAYEAQYKKEAAEKGLTGKEASTYVNNKMTTLANSYAKIKNVSAEEYNKLYAKHGNNYAEIRKEILKQKTENNKNVHIDKDGNLVINKTRNLKTEKETNINKDKQTYVKNDYKTVTKNNENNSTLINNKNETTVSKESSKSLTNNFMVNKLKNENNKNIEKNTEVNETNVNSVKINKNQTEEQYRAAARYEVKKSIARRKAQMRKDRDRLLKEEEQAKQQRKDEEIKKIKDEVDIMKEVVSKINEKVDGNKKQIVQEGWIKSAYAIEEEY
jgi:hypothetical protein